MAEPASTEDINSLFTRLRGGDLSARDRLFELLYDRIVRLTATVLKSFPIVRQRRAVESVANELSVKLLMDFDSKLRSDTADEFLGYAGMCLRHLLIDEADKLRRRQRLAPMQTQPRKDESSLDFDPATMSHDPAPLALLTEDWALLLKRIDNLPADERHVAEQRILWGASQAQIAKAKDWHPRKVSRLWISAFEKLLPAA